VDSLRRYRDTAIVVLLLAVPFFFLRANVRDPKALGAFDKAIIRISTPIQYAASALANGISALISDYVYLVDVKSDNRRLSYENTRLRNKVRSLEQNDAENQRMRKLLGLRETIPGDIVSAHVIAKDFTEFFRVTRVTLDRPARNIRPNMPVIALDGVVGTVYRVAGDTVDVLLTVDSGSGIDVVVERTGARGFVRGTGNPNQYACRVEYVQRADEVDVGDLLLTSGVGKRFPKGIPVARVTKVVKRDFGIYQSVEAAPAVDLSRLEDVLIVTEGEQPPGKGEER
jgi:rod shape-determining protein MreC